MIDNGIKLLLSYVFRGLKSYDSAWISWVDITEISHRFTHKPYITVREILSAHVVQSPGARTPEYPPLFG